MGFKAGIVGVIHAIRIWVEWHQDMTLATAAVMEGDTTTMTMSNKRNMEATINTMMEI